MSRPPKSPTAATVSGFNDMAARRGDGLHPLLLAALTKFGSVSGPAPQREPTRRNVIEIDFADQGALKKRDKAAL